MVTLGLFSLMGLYDRNSSPASVLKTTVDAVRMAEDFGFDVAWFAEHHFTNHSICPSSLMMVAHCAPETSKIRLGSAVLALPLYQPLKVVQEIAFADLLTRGRLVLGIGSGYQPHEFDRYRVDRSEKHARLLEAWTIIEQGLTSGVVRFKGRHFDIPRTELSMRPFGLAMPEVFLATSDAQAVARAAQGGHTPFMSFGHRGLDHALAVRSVIAEHWSKTPGASPEMPLGVMRFVYVTDDEADARHAAQCVRDLARAGETLRTGEGRRMDGPFLRLMPLNDEPPLEDFREKAVIGPASYCVDKLGQEIEALRPTHLACLMGFAGIGRRETLASIERFGYSVIPQLADVFSLRDGDLMGAA
ncbi:alkanesulfonate monooxygenase SsuD/methylene tetrahydromethanopterin reductase-like flavin-dependent oxidoreductase (luciferase family) [Rhodoligotrophos appendicifer]|uniref:LLM class flavin-dependent oxidoreductase n=1 Tax=Rhodoligotrophos appendicifer TaxID=987056 RepID=UPI0011862F2B|nr:LLM class flavin-dependent oxidoreductase [Rhodoligotrophos appendicifer]